MQPTFLKKTGGIRIANLNLTYPLCKICVEPERVKFHLFFFKTIIIPKEDLVEIHYYEFLPFIGEGILFKLKSRKKFGSFISKTDKIVFWYLGDKEKLLKEVKTILSVV